MLKVYADGAVDVWLNNKLQYRYIVEDGRWLIFDDTKLGYGFYINYIPEDMYLVELLYGR